MNSSIRIKLSVMMFLQFFIWGSWFATLGACLAKNELSSAIGGAYGSAPIAAIIAPLFLGLIADRFLNSEKAMALLHLIGGAILFMVPTIAAKGDGDTLVWMLRFHMLCYMPTLGLSNTVAFTNIDDRNKFPALRVWGTIGWIVAGLIVGGLGWTEKTHIFTLGAVSSVALGLLCFAMPATPPPARGKPIDVKSLLMFDAFKMLGKPAFFVFILCSTLICIPLAYYYAYTSNFLTHLGFKAAASTMTLGQISEIFFMLLVPFFFRRLGVKWMIVVGMLAWVVRYGLFAFGASEQMVWMILFGIILHGICYDFFFVTGFMYTDRQASPEARGQAQSMLVFFTQGIGMFFGFKVAFAKFASTVTKADVLTKEMPSAESFTFWESFGKMFTAEEPVIPGALFYETMGQWKEFWLFPCLMAAAIMILFAVAFWDKSTAEEKK